MQSSIVMVKARQCKPRYAATAQELSWYLIGLPELELLIWALPFTASSPSPTVDVVASDSP